MVIVKKLTLDGHYITTFQGLFRISDEGQLVYSSLLTVCHF